MKREVAPIACRMDFGVFSDLYRKLSRITTAMWYVCIIINVRLSAGRIHNKYASSSQQV